jgi:hypothetical protein
MPARTETKPARKASLIQIAAMNQRLSIQDFQISGAVSGAGPAR